MIRMRPFFFVLALVAASLVPAAALAADGQPSPTVVAACQAEAQQLGKEAFTAKYGPTEPFGHCFAAHAAAGDAPVATTTASEPTPPPPPPAAAPMSTAQKLCLAEAQSLGRDAFVAKYGGKEAFGQCVKATLAKLRAGAAACKAASGSNRDALRACIAAAAGPRTDTPPKRR
jgi:hypothetical protein